MKYYRSEYLVKCMSFYQNLLILRVFLYCFKKVTKYKQM